MWLRTASATSAAASSQAPRASQRPRAAAAPGSLTAAPMPRLGVTGRSLWARSPLDIWPVALGALPADRERVRLRYAIGGIAAAALICLPAGAAATPGGQVAGLTAQQCNQERAELGKKAFRKRYGAKHTMRNCTKRTRTQVVGALATATQECQNELATDGAAEFIDTYGDDPTDSVDAAMDECIAEDVDYLLNPDDYVDEGTDEGDD